MVRRSFSKHQKDTILAEQDLKCNLCGARFGKDRLWHFDHINGINSDNRTENGQAICANCHDKKSRKETVQRRRTKKDSDIVECCPLCGEDFEDQYELEEDDEGDEIEQSYCNANEWIVCIECESEFKIIRHDPSNIQESTNKEYEGVVAYCMHCGVEWEDPDDSNEKIICEECNSKFYVWIKKYNE